MDEDRSISSWDLEETIAVSSLGFLSASYSQMWIVKFARDICKLKIPTEADQSKAYSEEAALLPTSTNILGWNQRPTEDWNYYCLWGAKELSLIPLQRVAGGDEGNLDVHLHTVVMKYPSLSLLVLVRMNVKSRFTTTGGLTGNSKEVALLSQAGWYMPSPSKESETPTLRGGIPPHATPLAPLVTVSRVRNLGFHLRLVGQASGSHCFQGLVSEEAYWNNI